MSKYKPRYCRIVELLTMVIMLPLLLALSIYLLVKEYINKYKKL